jgi:hypothetical protein
MISGVERIAVKVVGGSVYVYLGIWMGDYQVTMT